MTVTVLAMPDGELVVTAETDRETDRGWRFELSDPEAGARWLVEQLSTLTAAPWPDGEFQLQRFGRPPAVVAAGERLLDKSDSPANVSVVVGEQLLVKWLHRTDDENLALRTIRHLEEVGLDLVPATFGILTWSSPSGRELPCAFVTQFRPDVTDGWQWCVDALENGTRPGFPAELGLLVARLHVGLGSPTSVLPLPMLAVGAAKVQGWHAQARQRLTELTEQIDALTDAPAGPEGEPARQVPAEVLARHRTQLETELDRLLTVPGRTPIQLIHGDLHVGQILSGDDRLSVIDFDGGPALGGTSDRQPAARDVAQMLISLDQVGRIVDLRSGWTRTAEIEAWSKQARTEFLLAYRAELERVERRDVLDTRLLPSFLVEQAIRDLLYSVQFLPRWAYATIDGLETILGDLPEPDPAVTPQFSVPGPVPPG